MAYSGRDVTVEILSAGDGITYPTRGNTVSVHYTGSLKDGRIFDSSRDRGKMFKFKLGADQVIPGWVYSYISLPLCRRILTFLLVLTYALHTGLDMGVAQLSKGERAIMTIPAHLAYGDKGFPGLIPGKSELIFDIELIEIS